jgi:transposase, IS30 family
MGTHYEQLTESERCAIHRLRMSGLSVTAIGCELGRNKGTISRELRRNALPKSGYLPASADRMAWVRRHRKRRSKIERSSWLLATIRDHLIAMGRSPEQIAGQLEREDGKRPISTESIYRFIYGPEGRKAKLHRHLPQAKASRGRRSRKGAGSTIPNRVSIHDRPESIESRDEFGHWEGDLMAFSQPGHNNLILVERKSRFLLAAPQSDKTAETTAKAIAHLLSRMPALAKQSITFDNGGEFARHDDLDLPAFFCDPKCPWQKGSVENAIGRLRRDMPRSTKPTDHSLQDFHEIIHAYNQTPRKCLGFQTPEEVFLSEFNH